jgi:tetratricopeptide (TPR) repeat protein
MPAEPIEKLRAIANHWLSCRRLDQAEPVLRDILAIEPQDAEAMNQLAAVLIDSNQLDEAAELSKTAIGLQPQQGFGYANLARVLMAQRKLAPAIEAARTAVRLQPNTFHLGLLSRTLFSAGNLPDASAAAKACLAHDPGELNSLAVCALYSLSIKDYKQAEKYAGMLLQHGPIEGFCLTLAATVFREIGRRTEGMQLLRSYIQREPNNARAHEAMGLACWNRGDVPGARRYFREALRLDPRMERVRQILRMHTKTRPQDMPEGWVLTRYVDYRDNRGQKVRVILDEKRRPDSV